MKLFLLCILLGLLTFTVSAQQKRGEIDLKINGVGLDSTYLSVINRLGKPLQKKHEKTSAELACSGADEKHLTLFYADLEVKLLGVGKSDRMAVVEIEVKSNTWNASGIKIGADIKDVKAKFGEPYEENKSSNKSILYYVSKGNSGFVNFEFLNNKLVKILIKETLC